VSRLSNTPGRDGTKFLGFIEVPFCRDFKSEWKPID
jgi:hypothetical protein